MTYQRAAILYRVTWNGGHWNNYRDSADALAAMARSRIPARLTLIAQPTDTVSQLTG